MQFSSNLLQHYFLEVDPVQMAEVRDALRQPRDAAESEIGPWTLMAWLDRPAIWGVRAIQKTSGLDAFLFDDHGLPGVTDVAEIITFPLQQEAVARPLFANDWRELCERKTGPGVLFATFLWPDWNHLRHPGAFGSGVTLRRSEILDAIRLALEEELRASFEHAGLPTPPLLLAASAGDADLVLYGWIADPQHLDHLILRTITRLDQQSLCRVLALPESPPPFPVFRASQTELAMDLDLYLRVRQAVAAHPSTAVVPDSLVKEVRETFAGDLFAEIGLARGRGLLTNLGCRLEKLGREHWMERAIFGGEDVVLSAAEGLPFERIVQTMACLDEELVLDPSFVRRSSLRLGVQVDTAGRECSEVELIGRKVADLPSDHELELPDNGGLEQVRKEIARLAKCGWREDVRIIERMVERCVTLQKSLSMGRDTRRMVGGALKRIVSQMKQMERIESDLQSRRQDDPDYEPLVEEMRILRTELLVAGMALDRALSHHSKGVVALLLHPSSQARGSEHIASELGLSLGLGTLFRSAADSVIARMETLWEQKDEVFKLAFDALKEIRDPTIYVSHDPDFSIQARLAMLRVPRWSLWQPSAFAHLMHEFGHALAAVSSLSEAFRLVILHLLGTLKGEDQHFTKQAFDSLGWTTQQNPLSTLWGTDVVAEELQYFCVTDGYADSKKLDDLEEIVCDITARLFAHPPSEDWDAEWLEQNFRYLLPFTGRNIDLRGKLSRLLAAHIAFSLLRAVHHHPGGRSLLTDPQAARDVLQAATEQFITHVSSWKVRVQEQVDQKLLPAWVFFSLDREIKLLLEDIQAMEGSNAVPWAAFNGVLAASALSIKPHAAFEESVSLFKFSLIWTAALGAAWHRPVNDADILNALADRRVPTQPCHCLEKLPSQLTKRVGLEIPPAIRLALSFCLYDNLEN